MKKKYEVDGIQLASAEEMAFYYWCKEAKKFGYLDEVLTNLPPIALNESKSFEGRNIIRKINYTPDFKLIFNAEGLKRFNRYNHCLTFDKCLIAWIDVKGGGFAMTKNVSHATFPVKRAWLYEKTGIYVNKVVPYSIFSKGTRKKQGFFSRTFCPVECYYKTRGNGIRAQYRDCQLHTGE